MSESNSPPQFYIDKEKVNNEINDINDVSAYKFSKDNDIQEDNEYENIDEVLDQEIIKDLIIENEPIEISNLIMTDDIRKNSEVQRVVSSEVISKLKYKESHKNKINKSYSDDFIIESFYSSCIGSSNIYQYVLAAITVIAVVFQEIIPISIAFFEVKPTLNLTEKATGLQYNDIIFDYKYCNKAKYNITDINYPEYSIVSEFGFYCNSEQVGLLGSTIFSGVLLGAFCLQILANALGKKVSFLISSFLFSVFAVGMFFNKSTVMLFVLIFGVQFFAIMSYYIVLMFLIESSSARLRPIFSSFVNAGYCVCGIVFSLMYYIIPNWRVSMMIVSIGSLGIILFMGWYSSEHPRFYYNNKNVIKFIYNCQNISKRNSKTTRLNQVFSEEFKHYLIYCYSCVNNSSEIYDKFSHNISIEKQNNSINISKEEKLLRDSNNSDLSKTTEQSNFYILSSKEMIEIKENINEANYHIRKIQEMFEDTQTYNTNIENNKFEVDKENTSDERNRIVSSATHITARTNQTSQTKQTVKSNMSLASSINVTSHNKYIYHTRKILFFNFIAMKNNINTNDKDNKTDDKRNESQIKIFLKLITYSSQRKVFLVMCLKWFIVTGIYYSVNILLKDLVGSLFLNTILLNCFELCTYIITSLLVKSKLFKRKGTYYLLYSLTIASSISCFIFNIDSKSLLFTGLILLSRLFIAGLFGVNITYSLEYYPFTLRTFGFGFNNMSGRISAIICPMLVELINKQDLPLYISGGCIICLLLVTFIPETMGVVSTDYPQEDNDKEIKQ